MGVPLPAGVRAALALPHARGDEPAFGNVPFALGVQRRRRLRNRGPQLATLQWSLPASQLPLWHAWYENDLQGGALAFDAVVQGRLSSGGVETIEARFAEPPRTAIRSAWATITAAVVMTQDVAAGPGLLTSPEWWVASLTQTGFDPPDPLELQRFNAVESGVFNGGSEFFGGGRIWLARVTAQRSPAPSLALQSEAANPSQTFPTVAWFPVGEPLQEPTLEWNGANLWYVPFLWDSPGTIVIHDGPLRTSITFGLGYPVVSFEYAWVP